MTFKTQAVCVAICAALAASAAAQTATDHSQHAMPPKPVESAHGGHDMSPVDVTNAPKAPAVARGGQDLASQVVGGVRNFDLFTGVVRWEILPGIEVGAYAYNLQIPGPTIRVKPGERVRFNIANRLPAPTTIHWHGLDVPFEQDGVHGAGLPPIAPGAGHAYEFTVPDTAGTFFYHAHFDADRQQALGLYGAFVIEGPAPAPAIASEHLVMLGEWRVTDGKTYPAMQMDGMLPNYFTFNGKSYPSTDTVKARVGDRLLFRLIGSGQFIHPIHIHGGAFEIVATDGHPVPPAARLKKDTVLIGPGERYDVLWTALRPGRWMLHCHINHHTTNDGAESDGGGGMMMMIDVEA
jgi:FtsP/CotA-like multicopper oxidase with cupredoxin domain